MKHQKLEMPRAKGRPVAYADLYRFGEGTAAAPLLVYVGGAVPRERYLARRMTAPDPIATEVQRARVALGLVRLDALICPCPVDTRPDDEDEPLGPEWMVGHLEDDLLPALGSVPTDFGFVGHSAGAAFALYLGVFFRAPAVATLGGTGLPRMLEDRPKIPSLNGEAGRELDPGAEFRRLVVSSHADGWGGFELAMFRNEKDQAEDPHVVARLVHAPLRARPQPAKPGAHHFEAYVANGEAAAAFQFVLARLAGRTAS